MVQSVQSIAGAVCMCLHAGVQLVYLFTGMVDGTNDAFLRPLRGPS